MDMNSISNYFNTYYPESPTQEDGSSSHPDGFSSFLNNPNNYTNPYDYTSSFKVGSQDYPYHDAQLSQYGYASPSFKVGGQDCPYHDFLPLHDGQSNANSDDNSDDDPPSDFTLDQRLVSFDTSDFTIKPEIKALLEKVNSSSVSIDNEIDANLARRKDKPESSILNTNEYMSISLYAGGLYKPLNKMLRDDPSKADNPVAQSISSGLAKLAEIPENNKSYVHRGVWNTGSDEQIQKNFQVGKTYSDPAFMSTSTSRLVASRFTGSLQLHIASQSAVSIASISGFGDLEKEAVIPPNTRMKVTDLKKAGHIWHVNLEEQG